MFEVEKTITPLYRKHKLLRLFDELRIDLDCDRQGLDTAGIYEHCVLNSTTFSWISAVSNDRETNSFNGRVQAAVSCQKNHIFCSEKAKMLGW